MKNYERCHFVWILTSFDLRSNLGLTRGILVILAKKFTLGASMFERVAPRHSRCPCGPMERKWYFWIFRGPACKSRVDKIQYQQQLWSHEKKKKLQSQQLWYHVNTVIFWNTFCLTKFGLGLIIYIKLCRYKNSNTKEFKLQITLSYPITI